MAQGYDQYRGDDAAGLALLAAGDHGHLALWNPGTRQPAISFMHYVLAPAGADAPGGDVPGGDVPGGDVPVLLGHLANSNPMLAGLERDPQAVFTVFGPTAYVPSYFAGEPRGVPTSYYSWGQFAVDVELVRDEKGLLAILHAMLDRLQPEGGAPPMDPTERYWQGMLGAITGLRMQVRAGASRFKYGQNKPARTRQQIVTRLRERGAPEDVAAAEQVLAHLPPPAPGPEQAGGEE